MAGVTVDPAVWAAERAERVENFLGRLELSQRLRLELAEEDRTSIIEAKRRGADIKTLSIASGYTQTTVRKIIREGR